MDTAQTIERSPQAEEIWAMLKEIARRQEETDQQMKETDKKIGKLSNRFGEVVEYMVVPSLAAKFQEFGFTFTRTQRDTEIQDRKHRIFTEVYAFLENGDSVMIVETKTKPSTNDVDSHVERMEKLRRLADLHEDSRKYYGAVAGAVVSESVKVYALKKGFFVIVPSGDSFVIIKPEGAYSPHIW